MEREGMEVKSFPALGTKVVNETQGIVEHIITVFGVYDKGGDVSHPGSFAKTLAERGTKVRVVDSHKYDSVLNAIGKPLEIHEVSRDQLPVDILQQYPEATGGVWARTQFLMDTPEGKGAFIRIKEQAIDEWSYGYDALDVDYDKRVLQDGKEVAVRNLRTIRLYEYSPVLWGMNPATATLSAKEGKPAPEVTENTIRIRVRDPGDFQEGTFRTIRIGEMAEGIQAVVGRLEGETSMTVQSYIFDREKWTMARAQAWVQEHRKMELTDIETTEDEKAATGAANLPLAPRERAWDARSAEGRVRTWAGAQEGPTAKYRRAFFWYDAADADNFRAYKLLFADVINGTLTAIPRGIFAVAAVLQGSRGGVDIPAADAGTVKGKVASYYSKMRAKFDDDSIVPPWEKSDKAMNLTQRIETVSAAINARYNPKNGPWEYWVIVVYDEYAVVQHESDSGAMYYQVPYKVDADGEVDLAPRAEWIEGDFEFKPKANEPDDEKAGRVLAARNATRLRNALATIVEVLEDAGIELPSREREKEEDEDDEKEKGDAKWSDEWNIIVSMDGDDYKTYINGTPVYELFSNETDRSDNVWSSGYGPLQTSQLSDDEIAVIKQIVKQFRESWEREEKSKEQEDQAAQAGPDGGPPTSERRTKLLKRLEIETAELDFFRED